jgi:transcription-repair coupling factor (superfamily II helicase)
VKQSWLIFASCQLTSSCSKRAAAGISLPGQGLPRAARLPVLSALHADLNRPILLITGRADRALTLLDELGFWARTATRRYFPEPNPLFYEQAAWGNNTRRDRLQTITSLALYHLPGSKPAQHPIMVAPVRAVWRVPCPGVIFSSTPARSK